MRVASVVAVAILVGGCAGEQQETKKSSTTAAEETQTPGAGVTPEQNDAIDALFRRKAHELQECWSTEYEKTQNRKVEGDVTVGLTVTTSGKPTDVKVLKSSLNNGDIESCVQKTVATWSFPELSAECPYTRTVHLGAEF